MLSELLLLSGNDIPFTKGSVTIHQPTMKEIAFIGEDTFFLGCEMLNFRKDILSEEDQVNLADKSNFEVFLSIMKDKQTSALRKNRISALMVLSLIFPDYKIGFTENELRLRKTEESQNEDGEVIETILEEGKLNKDNFEDFKDIIVQMFCLRSNSEDEYNPVGEQARRLAEKMKKGRQKAAEAKGGSQKVSVFNRYMSILAVGQYKTFEELNQYTVYQIFDEFERFELKENYDVYLRAKLAGAKDLEEVDNWMKDLHSDKK